MKIYLKDITPEGLSVEGGPSSEWIQKIVSDLSKPTPHAPALPLRDLHCSVYIYPLENGLFMKGQFNGTVKASCDRCAEEFSLPIQENELQCVVREQGRRRVAVADADGEADEDTQIHWVSGPSFELADVIGEYVQLAVPFKRVCRPDCKGLCGTCGKNLNAGPCACVSEGDEPEKESPFSKLKQVRGLCKT